MKPTNHTHEALQARACAILQGSFKLIWVEQELQIHDGSIDAIGKQPHNRYITAIECKASRSDLKQDLRAGKWKKYLPYCHTFWFLCNRGICTPDEIPGEAGIMFATPEGQTAKYRTGRKPPMDYRLGKFHREVTDRNYCMVIEGMFSKQFWRSDGWQRVTTGKQYDRACREWGQERERLEDEVKFLRDQFAVHDIDPQVPEVTVTQIRTYHKWRDKWAITSRTWTCPHCAEVCNEYTTVKLRDLMNCHKCRGYVKVGGLPIKRQGPGPEGKTDGH